MQNLFFQSRPPQNFSLFLNFAFLRIFETCPKWPLICDPTNLNPITESLNLEAARELIGPRGGLPTLRRDLVRLAALLNVPIQEKATVEEIKAAVRPMVQTMKGTKGKEPPSTPPRKTSQGMAPTSPSSVPPSPMPMSSPGASSSGEAPQVMEEMMKLMAAQEMRFQGMMNQVLQHVMTMTSQNMEAALGGKDELMTEAEYTQQQQKRPNQEMEEFTADEIARLNDEARRANDPETYAMNSVQAMLDVEELNRAHSSLASMLSPSFHSS